MAREIESTVDLGPAPPRYGAFISYSHVDLTAAKRLQRQLEGYRIPRRLVRSAAAGGPLGKRLRPIFRDIDELPASDDLSAEIKAALEASAALIVVASPAAKASPWVGREIETFRKIHGSTRPVLVALLQDEPHAAFPAALAACGIEPVAADFRKGQDGSRLALLKLVAGLSGVSLDTLVQRDAQARLRRVTAITVGALIAMLVMAMSLVFTLRARAEADRQRDKAEGLVEYMLTDLREKLKGVDRLDVMTTVNERAMDYYGDQQSLDSLSPESLNRRARILHAMGEDDEKRGDLALALKKFAEAHRTTAAVLARKPDDPAALIAHAQSEYWLGVTLQGQGRPRDTLQRYQTYLALIEQFARAGGDPKVAKRETGWAHNSLGVVRLRLMSEPALALGHFQKYRAAFEELDRAVPGNTETLYSLADALGWVADAEFGLNDLDAAKRHRVMQIGILERLVATDPKNGFWALEVIAAYRSLFRIYYRKEEFVAARRAIERADQLLNSRAFDRTNRAWLLQQSYVLIDQAFLAGKTGKTRQACDFRTKAVAAFGELRRMPHLEHSEAARFEETLGALKLILGLRACL